MPGSTGWTKNEILKDVEYMITVEDYRSAKFLAGQVHHLYPSDAYIGLQYALALKGDGQYNKAVDVLAQYANNPALSPKPTDTEWSIVYVFAQLLLKIGRWETAINALVEDFSEQSIVLRIPDRKGEVYLLLGDLFQHLELEVPTWQGKVAECYSLALKKNPKCWAAYEALADLGFQGAEDVRNIAQESSSSGGPATRSSRKSQAAAAMTSDDDLTEEFTTLYAAYEKLMAFESRAALELLKSLPPHLQDTYWANTRAGRAWYDLRDYKNSQKAFKKARQCHPGDASEVELMEVYSTVLWHLKDDKELSYLCNDLYTWNRFSAETWCALGNCYNLQNQHNMALKFFQRAIQCDPTFSYAYSLLGYEYILSEDYAKAETCFRSATKNSPRHYNAWYGLGLIYYRKELFEQAEGFFKQAIQIFDKSPLLYVHVALCLKSRGEIEKGLQELDRAEEAEPGNPLVVFIRAILLSANGKDEEALAVLSRLEEEVPMESSVYILKGRIYKKIGRPEEATMNFSWARDLDPRGSNTNVIIREALDRDAQVG
eukprot:Clim_evm15s25 gene=Clim_evmTU15s25